MKKLFFLSILLGMLVFAAPIHAEEQITYVSQPEKVIVFLNNMVFATDTLTLPGGSDVQIILPDQIYQDTLILRENGERVSSYTINRSSGQVVLQILTPGTADQREITMEYLTPGISWTPTYDMWITEGKETVGFTFFAEIQNWGFTLEGVDVTLAAGRVGTSGRMDATSSVTTNQYIAGYEDAAPTAGLQAGAVTIQHMYPMGALSSEPGDTLYVKVLEKDLPARRVLLWNAQTDNEVTVIYKVRNDSDIVLAEGIVRSYQDELFTGSDFMEFTPIGSEGSVTIGSLPDVRVTRDESVTYLSDAPGDSDNRHEVTLTMSNFSENDVELNVVDVWPDYAHSFRFSDEPQRDLGNLLRWTVTIPASKTVTIDYEFKTP